MKKQTILKTIKDLPNDVDLNDFFEQLIVRDKINKGLMEMDKGHTVPHEKVVKYFQNKWRKKFGV